jgi:hypothetical protein
MNSHEGIRRVAIVIRWVGFLAALGVASLMLYPSTWEEKALVFLLACVPAVASQGLAWIVDGFAAPHK